MDTSDPTILIDGLVYEDELPLRWEVVGTEPGLLDSLHINQQNRQLLSTMLAPDVLAHEGEEDSEYPNHELQRIEGKLNLLLGLVGKLLGQTGEIPAAQRVYLGGEGLQCPVPADFVFPQGGHENPLIRLEIFLNPQLPSPIVLIAEAKLIQSEDGANSLLASYQSLDQETQGLLEKFIFQQHRRLIAHSRRRS